MTDIITQWGSEILYPHSECDLPLEGAAARASVLQGLSRLIIKTTTEARVKRQLAESKED